MTNTKHQLNLYPIYDRFGIERHLERMAAKGWLLEQAGRNLWRYRRSEPRTAAYAVTYFPADESRLPGFLDYCAAGGWTYVSGWDQLQIFCAAPGTPPLETEPGLQLDTMGRCMRRHFIPGHSILLGLCLLLLATTLLTLITDPLFLGADGRYWMSGFCLAVLGVALGAELIRYLCWSGRATRCVSAGQPLPQGRAVPSLAILGAGAALLLFVAWWLSRSAMAGWWLALAHFAGILAILSVAELAHRKAETGQGLLLSVVVVVVLTLGLNWGLAQLEARHIPPAARPEEILADNTLREVEAAALPLTADDLLPEDAESDAAFARRRCSPLMEECHYLDFLADGRSIQYTVYTTRSQRLYSAALTQALASTGRWEGSFSPTDPTPWGASDAYQFQGDGSPDIFYVLCYPDRVVWFYAAFDLSAQQQSVVGATLG